jgi:hypothetical protein
LILWSLEEEEIESAGAWGSGALRKGRESKRTIINEKLSEARTLGREVSRTNKWTY